MSRVLFVTWDGGGNVPPQMGLIRGVAAEGHDVCVVTDASHQDWAADAAGGAERVSTYVPFAPEPGMPADNPTAYWFARRTAEGVQRVLAEGGVDVVVIDNMLASAFAAAEAAGVPSVAVFHQPWSFYYGGTMTKTWLDGSEFCNLIRGEMGLDAVARAQEVWDRCASVLVSSPRSFDVAARELTAPANVRWIGPIVDDPPGVESDVSVPAGDDPLVAISLSTHDMGQGQLLASLAASLAELPVRALITVGFGIDPATVPASPNVAVSRYANHLAAFEGAAAVVTHAGHGTVMAALARGVPLVCVPLGRDQHDMANFVFQLGCGLTVDGEAGAEVGGITGALDAVLTRPTYAEAAHRMAADIDPAASRDAGVHLILEGGQRR